MRAIAPMARRRLGIVGLVGAPFQATVAALGPRGDQQADEAPAATLPLPGKLAGSFRHLAQGERRGPGLLTGTKGQVVLGPAGPVLVAWVMICLHGFSASCQELIPLPEDAACAPGADYRPGRLTGYGSGRSAMTTGSVAAWKRDALDALSIGRRLGRRVLVIGVSNDAGLAAWLAMPPAAHEDTAWALVSPNFVLRDLSSEIVNAPWSPILALAVVGAEYRFEARNAGHGRHGTAAYLTFALTPPRATVHLACRLPLEDSQAPVSMPLSPHDQVMEVGVAPLAFACLGAAPEQRVVVVAADDASQHGVAGQILSPRNSPAVTATVLGWVQRLPERLGAPTQRKHTR